MVMSKEIVIVLAIGLVAGFIVGSQINRYKIETSGGRTLKVDRLTGKSWVMISGTTWRELKDD